MKKKKVPKRRSPLVAVMFLRHPRSQIFDPSPRRQKQKQSKDIEESLRAVRHV